MEVAYIDTTDTIGIELQGACVKQHKINDCLKIIKY